MSVSTLRTNQKKTVLSQASYAGWRIWFVIIIVGLFGGLAARSLFGSPEQQVAAQNALTPPGPGGKLPSFSLIPLGQSLMTGQAYTNKNLDGHKTIFLIVKATCPHCLKECAWLRTYLPQLEGRATIVVASVSNADETAQFAASTGLSSGIYLNGAPLAIETGIRAVPDLFLLDDTGAIRYFHQGELDPQNLQTLLETFLRGGDLSQMAWRATEIQGRMAS